MLQEKMTRHAPTIIKITPGADPYSQLDLEEEELEYKVGDESTSEIHPDDDEVDDLSCITIDSLKHIDNDKVKEIWKGMVKLKQQEGEYYENLARMVDEMSTEVIYQSVQVTPRPSTNVPPCADELLHELGSKELFQRVLAIGYMNWQGFEKNRRKCLGEKYKPNTICEVAVKFDISTSRLMDLRRGAAINREDTQCSKMLKVEKKRGRRGQNSYRITCSFTRGTKYSTTIHFQGVKRLPTKTKNSVLFGTTKYSQSK